MRKKYLLCVFLLVSFSYSLVAQHSLKSYYLAGYEGRDLSRTTLGVNTGITIFKNDLHGLFEAEAQNSFMNFFLSLDASFRLTNYVSIRTGFSGYQLYGKPTENAATPIILETKPAVSSQNIEGYIAIKHDIFSRYRIDRGEVIWNAYGVLGIGMTWFEPENPVTGEKLRPLENGNGLQEYAYSSLMPIIPVGIGFSYYIADNSILSFEVTHRFSRTSWLDNAYHFYRVVDDIGQPITGSTDRQVYDGYTFVGFRYQYTILKGNGRVFSRRKYQKTKRK